MALIDANYFLTRHGKTDADFTPEFITAHLLDAELAVIDITSEESFESVEAILLIQESERTADQARQLDAFQKAMAEMLMVEIIDKINLVVGNQGVVRAATSKHGSSEVRSATPREIEEIKAPFIARAKLLLKRYIPADFGFASPLVVS